MLAAGLASLIAVRCGPPEIAPVQPVEEQPALLSSLHMADAQAAPQLLTGFYAVEQNAWRWTAKEFTVILGLPAGAKEKGARLRFRFVIPEVVHQKLGNLTLTLSVGGQALHRQTFTSAGQQELVCDIDRQWLGGDGLTVHFSLDKALPPGPVDRRELGVVAQSISLETR